MTEELKYLIKTTDELEDSYKEDFLYVFNTVFNLSYDKAWFDWKYSNNIYGPSNIVFVYDGEDPVAIRSFWRNDIGEESYQPCDTAVLEEYRGRGIFSKMSRVALEKLGGYLIYNFPNENSLPGNLKMGWKIRNHLYLKTVFSKLKLKKETEFIEDDYLKWRFIDSPTGSYHYCKKGDSYYLLINRVKNIYYVLGRFNGEYKDSFKKARKPVLFNYSDKETLMYKLIKNRANLVVYDNNKDVDSIPVFKADFF